MNGSADFEAAGPPSPIRPEGAPGGLLHDLWQDGWLGRAVVLAMATAVAAFSVVMGASYIG